MAVFELFATLAGARLVAPDLLAVGLIWGRYVVFLRLHRNGWGLLHDGDVVDNLVGFGVFRLLQLLVCQESAYDRNDKGEKLVEVARRFGYQQLRKCLWPQSGNSRWTVLLTSSGLAPLF